MFDIFKKEENKNDIFTKITCLLVHAAKIDEVYSNNDALEVYKHIGFKHEGTLREGYYNEGKYWDADLLSMLRGEYEEKYDLDKWKNLER